ncbi:hypothetical protein M758_9G144900 [Ceratodon purpureus]|uniref:Transmembrane protein n=1 Tax=Ceratodon purpureus TaxID=3225 RepID=A0A8T0GVL1_CERPU|nr:hypothetical protein KC19_9G147900 [Ceratodon purpureus]KAG0606491.1 hypothetical protein M758_9G144900 [Ceratodon purpureus]
MRSTHTLRKAGRRHNRKRGFDRSMAPSLRLKIRLKLRRKTQIQRRNGNRIEESVRENECKLPVASSSLFLSLSLCLCLCLSLFLSLSCVKRSTARSEVEVASLVFHHSISASRSGASVISSKLGLLTFLTLSGLFCAIGFGWVSCTSVNLR